LHSSLVILFSDVSYKGIEFAVHIRDANKIVYQVIYAQIPVLH